MWNIKFNIIKKKFIDHKQTNLVFEMIPNFSRPIANHFNFQWYVNLTEKLITSELVFVPNRNPQLVSEQISRRYCVLKKQIQILILYELEATIKHLNTHSKNFFKDWIARVFLDCSLSLVIFVLNARQQIDFYIPLSCWI